MRKEYINMGPVEKIEDFQVGKLYSFVLRSGMTFMHTCIYIDLFGRPSFQGPGRGDNPWKMTDSVWEGHYKSHTFNCEEKVFQGGVLWVSTYYYKEKPDEIFSTTGKTKDNVIRRIDPYSVNVLAIKKVEWNEGDNDPE